VIKRILTVIWGDQEGSPLLEATLLTPLLLILIGGVFEFSWYWYQQQAIEIGLRDAARYVARIAPSNDPNCSQADWPSARNLATTGSFTAPNPGDPLRIRGWTPDQVNFTCLAVPNAGGYLGGDGTNIYVIEASTTCCVPQRPSLGLLEFFHLGPLTITVSHEERTFGKFFP